MASSGCRQIVEKNQRNIKIKNKQNVKRYMEIWEIDFFLSMVQKRADGT